MAPYVSYILNPTNNMIQAKSIVSGKQVKVSLNNKIAYTIIPSRLKNMGYEELILFMENHPFSEGFFRTTDYMYPGMLAEFWYTCTYNSENRSITGTYRDGNFRLTITEKNMRRVLSFPARNNFVAPASVEEARQSFLIVGQTKVTGTIKMNWFTPRWRFVLSNILRSLGSKSGSLDQMNELEIQVFNAFVTGRDVDFVKLYFDDLIAMIQKETRDNNVPFIRFLSLMFEDAMGAADYAEMRHIYNDVSVPECSVKMFHTEIQESEVGLTPAMQHWVDLGNQRNEQAEAEDRLHQTETEVASESDEVASESDEASESESLTESAPVETQKDGVEGAEFNEILKFKSGETSRSRVFHSSSSSMDMSPPHGGLGMAFNFEDMDDVQPTHPDQSSPTPTEVLNISEANPMDSPIHMEKTPISSHNAYSDLQINEYAGVIPSGIAPNANTIFISSLLETEVDVSIIKPKPIPARLGNLESHIAATVQTHTVSIEDDVPLLDSNTPFCAHSDSSLHSSAQADNASVKSQADVQASNPSSFRDLSPFHQKRCEKESTKTANASVISQAGVQVTHQSSLKDLFSYQQERCEGEPTQPTTTPSQSEAPVSLQSIYDAMKQMHNKFDDKLAGVQSDINTIKNNICTRNELVEVKGQMSTLLSAIRTERSERANFELKHNVSFQKFEQQLASVEAEIQRVDDLVQSVDGLQTDIADLKRWDKAIFDEVVHMDPPDDVKKGEKRKGSQAEGEQSKRSKYYIPESDKRKSDKGVSTAEGEPEVKRTRKKLIGKKKLRSKGASRFEGCKTLSDLEARDESDSNSDDQPISSIFSKIGSSSKSEADATKESMSEKQKGKRPQEPSKTKTHIESDSKTKPIEMLTEMAVEQEIELQAEEAGMTKDEYLAKVKHDAEIRETDRLMAENVLRQRILAIRLKDNFSMQRLSSKIASGAIFDDNGIIRIDYKPINGKRSSTTLEKLYSLGFQEWKDIARFIKSMDDKVLKEKVMSEIILLVEVSHDMGYLDESDYKSFCVAFNIKMKDRLIGLYDEDPNNRTHSVPDGITFKENTYVKTDHHEGFLYKDNNGIECFQSVNRLHGTDHYHLFALLELCKDKQNLEFRRRVVRCLFYHLSELLKIPELRSKCERIRKEHRKFEKEKLNEVELVEKGRKDEKWRNMYKFDPNML